MSATNSANYTQGRPIESKSVLETFIENLSLICMPSSLWGVHLDLSQKYLAFSMLKISDSSLQNSKSVVLSETEDNVLKIDVFMNNASVEIPYISKNVSNLNDLNNLLVAIDTVEFCKYYLLNNKENRCLIFNVQFKDVCSRCLNRTDKKDLSEEEIDINKLCDITFSNSHKNDTNKIDNMECILCKKTFNVEENLAKHYKDHLLKNDDGYFECTVCLASFVNVIPIVEHYREYHTSVKFIKCSTCTKKFTLISKLRRHIRNHTGYLACRRCSKDFFSKQKLKTHTCIKSTRTRHTSKLHICSICNTRYSTNHLLQQHQREHQMHVSLKCKECNKKFDTEDQAVNHKMNCKNKQSKYACKMCDKKFSCVTQRLCHIKKVHRAHK